MTLENGWMCRRKNFSDAVQSGRGVEITLKEVQEAYNACKPYLQMTNVPEKSFSPVYG
jgi:hypothetical protein